ncbi:hypothetical protein D3C72_2503090 [compost metagenome]
MPEAPIIQTAKVKVIRAAPMEANLILMPASRHIPMITSAIVAIDPIIFAPVRFRKGSRLLV